MRCSDLEESEMRALRIPKRIMASWLKHQRVDYIPDCTSCQGNPRRGGKIAGDAVLGLGRSRLCRHGGDSTRIRSPVWFKTSIAGQKKSSTPESWSFFGNEGLILWRRRLEGIRRTRRKISRHRANDRGNRRGQDSSKKRFDGNHDDRSGVEADKKPLCAS